MTATRSRARRTMPTIINLDGDNTHLANLCGPLDENLRQLADGMGVTLARRGSRITLEGERAELAGRALRRFHDQAVHRALSVDDIQLGLVEMGVGRSDEPQQPADPRQNRIISHHLQCCHWSKPSWPLAKIPLVAS